MSKSSNNNILKIHCDEVNSIKNPTNPVNIINRSPKLDDTSRIDTADKIKFSKSNETNNGTIESFQSCFSATRDVEMIKDNMCHLCKM
eukprot:9330652-Ditylum_brightwellii.AAC.1